MEDVRRSRGTCFHRQGLYCSIGRRSPSMPRSESKSPNQSPAEPTAAERQQRGIKHTTACLSSPCSATCCRSCRVYGGPRGFVQELPQRRPGATADAQAIPAAWQIAVRCFNGIPSHPTAPLQSRTMCGLPSWL